MAELNRTAGEQSVLLKTKQDEADAALQEITVSIQVIFRGSTEMQTIGRSFIPDYHSVWKITFLLKCIVKNIACLYWVDW